MTLLNILTGSNIGISLCRIPTQYEYRRLSEVTHTDGLRLTGLLRMMPRCTRDVCRTRIELDEDHYVRDFILRFCQRWGADANLIWADRALMHRIVSHLTEVVYDCF